MSDKDNKSSLPDGWYEGVPAPDTPPGKKEESSAQQDHEDLAAQPAPEADQQAAGESQPEAEPRTEADLLDDVRRELMKEEQSKPKSKWSGIFKRKKKKTDQPDETVLAVEGKVTESPSETVDVSRVGDRAHVPVEGPRKGTGQLIDRKATGPLSDRRATGPLSDSGLPSTSDVPVESAADVPSDEDILRTILGIDTHSTSVEPTDVSEEAAETAVIDRREILRPMEDEPQVEIESLRDEALREYSDEPLQPEEQPSLEQKTRTLVRGLRPFEKILIIAIVAVVLIAAVFGVGAVLSSRQPPAAPATLDPNIPIPEAVTLPGGWSFPLSRGQLVDGKWNPTGPEWLEGTELCKWVALPWSTQLEAVVRTLKADDPIDLVMSNTDHLTFKVQSIRNVPVDEIETLETSATCLLLILADEEGDSRWVVTAIP